MSQHDYVIDNSTGQNVRADLNSALQAIVTNNSGSSAPSATFALQTFANTTDSMLQLRNAANNGFVNLRKFDGTLPLPDGSASSPSLFFNDDTNTGCFSGSADEFNIATGGTERFVINSSGNCGIGTLSPTARFDVRRSDTDGKIAEFHQSGGFGLEIGSSQSQAYIASGSNQSFSFQTNSGSGKTTRMVITSDGKVGINSSPIGQNLTVGGNRSTATNFDHSRSQISIVTTSADVDQRATLYFMSRNSSNQNCPSAISAESGGTNFQGKLKFYVNGAGNGTGFLVGYERMQISSNGDIGAPSGDNIHDASDERLKENIVELTNGLNKINKLKPISYNYKTGWNKDTEGKTKYGFGAQTTQEVDELLIEPFSNNDVDLNGVKISNLLRVNEKFIIPLLVKAVQELSAKVAALETA